LNCPKKVRSNAIVKIFSAIALALVIFLTGCNTMPVANRQPIPVSEVKLYETKGNYILTDQNPENNVPMLDPETGQWQHFKEVTTTTVPVVSLLKNSRYEGKIEWSGMLPEIYVPEYARGEDIGLREMRLNSLQDLPERMKNEIKAHAGQIGGNLVFVERWSYNYQWIIKNGNYEPKYLFWGKVYFVTNSP
jgi:hypothetical protein